MLQIYNFLVCRITYAKVNVFQKSLELCGCFFRKNYKKSSEDYQKSNGSLDAKKEYIYFGERIKTVLLFWILLFSVSAICFFLIEKGHNFGIHLSGLYLFDYIFVQIFGIGLLVWHMIVFSIFSYYEDSKENNQITRADR